MRDNTLIEPFAVQEIFVDGFSDHVISNGVMTCAGYRLQMQPGSKEPHRIVVIRLVMPAANINEAIDDARQAQSGGPASVYHGDRAKRH